MVLEVAWHNDRPEKRLDSREQVDAFVQELASHAPGTVTAATAYALAGEDDEPDHELLIGADVARGVGVARYSCAEGTWYLTNGSSTGGPVLAVHFGTPVELPPDAEVPLDAVRAALHGLLTHEGRRPDAGNWVQTT
ncbi:MULTISPECIES: Imm1 family immunity protein [Actinosynnema]|uniref:Imm1 family immunity protein n=1 Tax=Actinosynnema TaxID=40566 RepID=UPI0020A2B65B|nr:Imm1 family immunity protein [Actinosynnema pretiosum]